MDLRNDNVQSKPIDFDFSASQDWDEENEPAWALVYPDFDGLELEELTGLAEDRVELELEDDEREEQENAAREALTEWAAGHVDEAGIVPMMNYAYPIHLDDAAGAQATLMGAVVPLCVVEIGGDPFLALTGGGMDLSWSICEAYVALGLLPPAHFAGKLPNQGDPWLERPDVLDACVRSLQLAASWASRDLERLYEQIAARRAAA